MGAMRERGVLITGAGRGIGKRLALGFASRGARVGLLARSKAELDVAKLEIEHAGGVALRIPGDVRDAEHMSVAVDRMQVYFGAVHVLVCAAGIQGPIGPFLESSAAAWKEIFDTNVLGVMNSCRAVLPHMIERRSGKIIVIACDGAFEARPNFAAFAASHAAVVRYVESVADELRDHNVQINCMYPGDTYTSMTDDVLRSGERAGWRVHEQALRTRMTGGFAPQKQIELASLLASEETNHISGKVISVKDDWKRLVSASVHPEFFTLRRTGKLPA